jgi:dehydrogenase/reductase SDR family protein 12
MPGPLDALLDASVFWSFDASGFERHARGFAPGELEVDLQGAPVWITGANSGIGFETSRAVMRARGEAWLLCRDRSRGQRALERLAGEGPVKPRLLVCDMSDLASVRAAAAQAPVRLHALVHNAGALDSARGTTPQGLENTFATHVAGPHLLTRLLGARCARVVFVSSGGAYTQPLDVAATLDPPEPFDGVRAYARCKRAQIVLGELWAERLPGVGVHVMHPGWAATPGVAKSLPGFDRWMQGRMRTAAQGADTVAWLVLAERVAREPSGFWFDRRRVSPHLLPWTRSGDARREELWRRLESIVGGASPAVRPPPPTTPL